jgi:hypothetical protein
MPAGKFEVTVKCDMTGTAHCARGGEGRVTSVLDGPSPIIALDSYLEKIRAPALA